MSFSEIYESYESPFDEFFGGVGHDTCSKRVDFGGKLERDPDLGFLGLDHDLHLKIFTGFFITARGSDGSIVSPFSLFFPCQQDKS